jgi:hypothetical protein
VNSKIKFFLIFSNKVFYINLAFTIGGLFLWIKDHSLFSYALMIKAFGYYAAYYVYTRYFDKKMIFFRNLGIRNHLFFTLYYMMDFTLFCGACIALL